MRFLTPDRVSILDDTMDNIDACNLYVYCMNNPVMYVDPDGRFAISLAVLGLIIGAAVGARVGFASAAYVDYKGDGVLFNGDVKWYDYVGASLLGGVIGGAIGYGAGALITHFTGIVGLSFTKYYVLPIKTATILGSYPAYKEAAKELGASYYEIDNTLYSSLNNYQKWSNNSQFIRDANKLGSVFYIYSDKIIQKTKTLLEEIRYLIEQGIPWEII